MYMYVYNDIVMLSRLKARYTYLDSSGSAFAGLGLPEQLGHGMDTSTP